MYLFLYYLHHLLLLASLSFLRTFRLAPHFMYVCMNGAQIHQTTVDVYAWYNSQVAVESVQICRGVIFLPEQELFTFLYTTNMPYSAGGKRVDFQRPVAGVCLAYRAGICKNGPSCKFIHDVDDGKIKQVFVGNLHNDICEDELLAAFENYGKVTAVRWGTDRRTRKFRNFAHIEFITSAGAENALDMDGKEIMSRPTRCSMARGVPQKKRNVIFTPKEVEDREAAKKQREEEKEKSKCCLNCRSNDHVLKDCPLIARKSNKRICYNCGDTSHRAAKCRKATIGNGFTFATCFICNTVGHLSSQCPKNANGIYPNGGGCRVCGSNQHLVKDCPEKGSKKRKRKKEEAAEQFESTSNAPPEWR